MNLSLQKALHLVTQQQDINKVTAEDLQQLSREYPYFSLPHLLLCRKLKESSEEGFLQQARKTAVYINDPFWLHYQLYSVEAADELSSPEFTEEPVQHPAQQASPANAGLAEETDVATLTEAPSFISEPALVHSEEPSPANTGLINQPGPALEDEDQQIPDELHPEPEVIQEEIASGETIPYSDQPDTTAPGEEAAGSLAAADEISAEVPKPVSVSEEELAADEQLLLEITHHEEPATLPAESDENRGAKAPAEPDLERQVAAGLEGHTTFSKDIEARTKALINPHQAANDGGIPFEPYHTIDYFASQGIQLVLDANPDDKLGKQLKKFTQWLKHMKRLGPEDALETVKDNHLETTIQKIADTSNTPRDVVTETMAQVLVKQGKTEQALQLYDKLSFLNPDKSAYFAAKIQTLKGS
ncbi:hypothetical protein EXU57_09870 [Segetibacter sp. 3557_3]|uniref:hypothetical protein n=1 Tax=Segetibacter sp. 3557_3 TaxID=2547429 RepID=UPI0010586B50|nr:hypothetical protein [Segetibacter sp. 3557_3]TDH26397.1 hypothetical protein EXU57_09870 [Segetibacter sp. 3557_3]